MTSNLPAFFSDLSTLLHRYQSYWRPMAFHQIELAWMAQHPALVQRLLGLSPHQIEHLATDSTALTDFVVDELPFARELAALSILPVLPQYPVPQVPPRFYAGIPGRKWQQVEAFASSVPVTTLPILEWCAGKSHLGFFLHQCNGQSVTALEWDSHLVQQANARAVHANLGLHSHAVDVLAPDASRFVQSAQQVVALHACGELHECLLALCASTQVRQLHLAPCCYHKRRPEIYVPLSAQGQATALRFNKAELHTAVMETATAGAALQRQRVQLQIMRLGFDCLQREVLGSDCFLPVPSLPAKWARADFADFCRHCATLKNITLPDGLDWAYYRQRGEQRFWQVSALDLVRFLFRRPLEIWLLLDRALLLQEHGYHVRIGTFCPPSVTPRNVLLQASLP